MIQRIGDKRPKHFACIDLTSGYHQILLAAESRLYTAFITTLGLFEWLRVPFGLKGTPAIFQHLMVTVVLAGIIYVIFEIYIDDICDYGTTEDEYFENLQKVFMRLQKHKLTINPDKGTYGTQSIDFVGHHITHEGVAHNRERIQKFSILIRLKTQNN